MYKKLYSLVLFFVVVVLPFECWGQISASSTQAKKFELTVGKSLTLNSAHLIKRCSVVAPEIADILVTNPKQVYVTGKSPGLTSLTFWGTDDQVFAIVNLDVKSDLTSLDAMVKEFLPEEKNIKFKEATNHQIAVIGTVSSAASLSQIIDMAHGYIGKDGKVINLAEVSGIQQVMIEVRVVEISHGNLKKLGINWSYLYRGENYAIGAGTTGLGGAAAGILPATGIQELLKILSNNTSTNTLFGGIQRTHNSAAALIDALDQNELIRVLARPTLVTLTGKPAEFLAGGEIPIPVPQNVSGVGGTASTITIEYKPFGVGLRFLPVVLGSKKINMTIAPEVSEPDFSNSIVISNFIVPSFSTRRMNTTIELDDGQSFAIAGLLRDENRKVISKFPLLGDIPILGALFRSQNWQKNETELIVIATPHLVKPTDMVKQPLPDDQFKEPSDFDFYLKGRDQGNKKNYKPIQ